VRTREKGLRMLVGSLLTLALSVGSVTGGVSAEAQARPRLRVVIDISSQRLKVIEHGKVILRSRVSTGSGRYYCAQGRCGHAVTPMGRFHVQRKIKGWREAPLGLMYKPIYFFRGYAIHGSLTVPRRPRSHGCVRVPLDVSERLGTLLHVGDVVVVRR
jgi:lipoprotein-anchoring transpeptidase ErfK/SrfK